MPDQPAHAMPAMLRRGSAMFSSASCLMRRPWSMPMPSPCIAPCRVGRAAMRVSLSGGLYACCQACNSLESAVVSAVRPRRRRGGTDTSRSAMSRPPCPINVTVALPCRSAGRTGRTSRNPSAHKVRWPPVFLRACAASSKHIISVIGAVQFSSHGERSSYVVKRGLLSSKKGSSQI